MPYLRISCPDLPTAQRVVIAQRLTEAVNDLFYNPRAPTTREELRERTTIHFMPYAEGELFIGGRTPSERGRTDITVELSDWNMPVSKQREAAAKLTPVLLQLFGIFQKDSDSVNIRFHSYAPTDFAVGGKLLADRVPIAAQWAKKLFG